MSQPTSPDPTALAEDLRRAAARTSTLLRVAGALNAQLDLARMVVTVCTEAAAAVSVPLATVWLFDEQRDAYVFAGGLGLAPHLTAALLPVPRTYYERYFQAGGPLFIMPDLAILADAPNLAVIHQLDLRTNVFVTMAREGHHIGYLWLAARHQAREFSTDELELLVGLADQAALAIQNARLYETVREHRERLRGLSARLVETQEVERRRLARELHDEVGQQLTSLQIALELASRGPDAAPVHLARARQIVTELIDQVHDLSLALRPTMLDDLGLLPALLWHFERFTAQTGLPVRFEQKGAARRLPAEVETGVYRIIQEALTNAARHAQATAVTVRVWAELDRLGVLIEDAGQGFDVEAALGAHASSGLSGMLERAALLGGTLTLESAPGEGTQVTLELPLRPSAREAAR
jgi:signal transduction histidine kinase